MRLLLKYFVEDRKGNAHKPSLSFFRIDLARRQGAISC